MAGINVDEVVDLGGCNAVINGVNVGHFDENGLTAAIKSIIVEAFAAKYGMLAIKRFLNGQTIDLEGELIQTNMSNLAEALPGATVVTNLAGDKKLTFGKIGGTEIPSVDLVLSPFLTDNTPTYDLTLKVTPVGDFELLYSGNGIQKWKVKWSAVVNEATGADGSYAGEFGDPSITQDTVAPAVTSVTPANAATPTAPAGIVWVLTKELNPATVSGESVAVIEDDGTPTEKVGTVVLVNNGTSTTITFTPTTAFTGSKQYIASLNGITDKAGNALPFYASQFTPT